MTAPRDAPGWSFLSWHSASSSRKPDQPFLCPLVPSGEHTKSNGKLPFIMSFPIKNGGSFHGFFYVHQAGSPVNPAATWTTPAGATCWPPGRRWRCSRWPQSHWRLHSTAGFLLQLHLQPLQSKAVPGRPSRCGTLNMERGCESGLNQAFDQPFDEDVNGDMLYVWFLEIRDICYMLNQEFPTVTFDENMLCCILSPTWYEIWMSENEGSTLFNCHSNVGKLTIATLTWWWLPRATDKAKWEMYCTVGIWTTTMAVWNRPWGYPWDWM